MSLEVAQIVAQWGAYYKPGSDNEKNLRNMLYKPSETAAFFAPRPTSDTIYRGTLATLNRIVQPFQKAYTPIGEFNFQPNEFALYKLKIDMQEDPDDLEQSYLGFLADLPEADRSKWPFVRWAVENHIKPKRDEDLEENEYFAGEYAAPAAGIAGAAGTAMNGLRKVIRGYNTAGRTNLGDGAIVTGPAAADPSDWCTQVEEFVRSIPRLFRGKIDKVFMDPDLELKFRDGKDAKYNMQYAKEADLLTINKFPHIKVQGLESHAGSNLIWATIPANRVQPIKKAALKDTLTAKEFSPRQVSIYGDWWECLNFEVPEFIFHNDQDLA
ncbi:MAG TPA: hypothetical protein VFS22_10190 [Flavisolibacter sp.]|nr:hypothetical protein [Flavisolibacter sp.]